MIEGWESGSLIEDTMLWHEVVLTSVDLATISQWYEIEVDDDYDSVFYIYKTKSGFLVPYID